MRTHAKICRMLAMSAMLLLGASGCGEEVRPETRIWLAGQREPDTSQDDRLACKLEGVADDQGVSIRHLLPEGVETELSVQVRLETPCTSTTATMKHDTKVLDDIERGVAHTTVIAPAGATCSLSVIVEIANDRQICTSRDENPDVGGAADPACKSLDEVCAAVDDDPERATTTE